MCARSILSRLPGTWATLANQQAAHWGRTASSGHEQQPDQTVAWQLSLWFDTLLLLPPLTWRGTELRTAAVTPICQFEEGQHRRTSSLSRSHEQEDRRCSDAELSRRGRAGIPGRRAGGRVGPQARRDHPPSPSGLPRGGPWLCSLPLAGGQDSGPNLTLQFQPFPQST